MPLGCRCVVTIRLEIKKMVSTDTHTDLGASPKICASSARETVLLFSVELSKLEANLAPEH